MPLPSPSEDSFWCCSAQMELAFADVIDSFIVFNLVSIVGT